MHQVGLEKNPRKFLKLFLNLGGIFMKEKTTFKVQKLTFEMSQLE